MDLTIKTSHILDVEISATPTLDVNITQIGSDIEKYNGDYRTNKTPTNPTRGDHYVFSDSSTAKYRVYTGTSWS